MIGAENVPDFVKNLNWDAFSESESNFNQK